MPAVLIDNVIREDIHKIGFANTMQKYRIKYYLRRMNGLTIRIMPDLRTHEIKEPSGENYNRNISIFNAIGFQDPGISKDLKIIEESKRNTISRKNSSWRPSSVDSNFIPSGIDEERSTFHVSRDDPIPKPALDAYRARHQDTL